MRGNAISRLRSTAGYTASRTATFATSTSLLRVNPSLWGSGKNSIASKRSPNSSFNDRMTKWFRTLTALAAILFGVGFADAQMSRKPTPTREPAGAMNKRPDSAQNSLPRIPSRNAFDSIARVYHQGTPYALPHLMFVIDRRENSKIYFVNSQKYRFHKDFMRATYLIPRGTDVFKPVYVNADRRFIVGTIAWQSPVEKFTWELWEGDLATADMIRKAN